MSIKFLLDENIPYALIDLLKQRGFDVQHLKKMGKEGIRNGEVLTRSKTEHLLNAMVRLLDKQKDRFAEKNLIVVEDNEVKIYEG